MIAKIIYLPNSKTMMMKLMQSQLENIMKNKVIKNRKNLSVQNYKI